MLGSVQKLGARKYLNSGTPPWDGDVFRSWLLVSGAGHRQSRNEWSEEGAPFSETLKESRRVGTVQPDT